MWRAPSSAGGSGARLTGYQVVVRGTVDGKQRIVWRKAVSPPKRGSSVTVSVRRSTLGTGRHVVRVRARNDAGAWGSWSSARFTVVAR